jgi:parvulin-like peptidyl-prolyl isomerase
MHRIPCRSLAVAFWLATLPLAAQSPPATPTPPAPDDARAVATVNGQIIPERAVRRALRSIPPATQAQAREEIVNLLIDNALVEQYLQQMRVEINEAEVDKRLEAIKAEAKKEKKDFDEKLKESQLSIDELRGFIRADLRWEAFCARQTDEAKLKTYFDSNKEMFDGSQVRARHILLTPPPDDAKAGAEAAARLQKIKQQVQGDVTAGLAKLPQSADNLAREKERAKLTEGSFATLAKKESACPSKEFGGDVGWFSRAGAMVEPFSRAAYACKQWEMSEPVKTQFGYHLILVTDRKPGKEPKYDEVKMEVKNVYGEKLREAVVVMMRQRAKIEMAAVKPAAVTESVIPTGRPVPEQSAPAKP